MANVYAVRDRKAGVFHRPFYERDHVMAIRGFEDACRKEDSPFRKWPSDFELLHLGNFEDASGRFTLLETPAVMAEPNQFLDAAKH